VVKHDDQPILTPGPMGSRNKSKAQGNSSKRRNQTGGNVIFREVLQAEQKQSKEIKKQTSLNQLGKKTKGLRI
jgi:hypothetical protein